MSGTRSSTHPGGGTSSRGDAAHVAALLGGALLGGLLTVVLARRVVALAGGLAARPLATGPDELVELGILAAGVLVLAWLGASCALTAGCLLARGAGRGWRRGEAWVHRFAPALLRRALVVSVVAGLGIGGATGATAATRSGTDLPAVVAVTATVDPAPPVDLGWVVTPTPPTTPETTTPTADAQDDATSATSTATTAPTLPSTTPDRVGVEGNAPDASPAPVPAATPARTAPGPSAAGSAPGSSGEEPTPAPGAAAARGDAGTVVVASGDTLWGIAARHLGGDPTDAAIAAAWPAWYDANAATIGADPGLILPGQVLRVPAAVGTGAVS